MRFSFRLETFVTGHLSSDFITELLVDGSNRGVITDSNWLSVLMRQSEGTFKYTKLEEKIISDHWGFVFPVDSFMFKAFDRKISQLVESGIAQKIVEEFVEFSEEKPSDDPAVLTLGHLDIWFYALMGLLCVALLCFLAEIWMKRKSNTRVQILSNK
jgi:phosphoribosyl-ATP pyrophosphohydrolase